MLAHHCFQIRFGFPSCGFILEYPRRLFTSQNHVQISFRLGFITNLCSHLILLKFDIHHRGSHGGERANSYPANKPGEEPGSVVPVWVAAIPMKCLCIQ